MIHLARAMKILKKKHDDEESCGEDFLLAEKMGTVKNYDDLTSWDDEISC